MPVEVATVHVQEIPTRTEVTGTIQAVRRAHLAAKVMGTIDAMPVSLGQPVRVGELLVRIYAPDITARAAQANAQLEALRRELQRERSLAATGATAAEAVRTFEDRVVAAEAQVREAEAMVEYTEILAPFDGVVAHKSANPGDLAAPGVPLLEVHGSDQFELIAAVPESAAARLAAGDQVSVSVPATNVTFVGTVSEISSAADIRARTVTIKVAVPSGIPVRSGQFSRLQLSGAPRRALLVPASAVTPLGQMERVFTTDSAERAILRLVKTGGLQGGLVEILAGLSDGDRILVAPPPALREGQPLELRP